MADEQMSEGRAAAQPRAEEVFADARGSMGHQTSRGHEERHPVCSGKHPSREEETGNPSDGSYKQLSLAVSLSSELGPPDDTDSRDWG